MKNFQNYITNPEKHTPNITKI